MLVLRLHAQEADPAAIHDPPPAQEVPPAEGQDAALHALQHLVDVRNGDRRANGLALAGLGDHEPVPVEHELELHRVGVHVLLRVGHEAPVAPPGRVVDLPESLEVAPQTATPHLADADAVLRLELLRQLEHDRQDLRAVLDLRRPHVEVHRLLETRLLAEALVVGRMPGLLDHRLALEALDQHPRLVVHREVHRTHHAVPPALPEPVGGGVQQRGQRLGVLLELQEAEHAPAVVVEVVKGVVALGADPAGHAAVPAGQEELRVGVLEVGVEALREEQPPLQPQRGNPDRLVSMQSVRQLDELPQVPAGCDRAHVRRHGARPYMPTAIDLFAKARSHERLEQLQVARKHDLLPYFRLLEGPAGPTVEMEGRRRIMLGGNNYLGLTGDRRVKQAARDALDRYGTGVTGSRFMNGTLPIHLELERELADWTGEDDALVFTTGYLANTGCIATLLGPEDTVICDSGDHASILDAVAMSRARVRPFRHGRLERLETMLERAEGDGGGVLVVVD